jgi:hypothetical protein
VAGAYKQTPSTLLAAAVIVFRKEPQILLAVVAGATNDTRTIPPACDQSDSSNPSCSGGRCIYDGSRTYDANGFPLSNQTPRGMRPSNEMSIKDSRLLAEEMEPEAKVDATMISSKNGSTIMTVSIATVFTALGVVVASF